MTVSITFRKYDRRYYVSVDGAEVGWVLKWPDDNTWSFYATVRQAYQGDRMASGCSTRRDAVMEGLSHLEIYHRGQLVRMNRETFQDEVVVVDPAVLRAAYDQLLDQKYPESAGTP